MRSPPPPFSVAVSGPSLSQTGPRPDHQHSDDDDSSIDSGSDYAEKVAQKRQKRVDKVGHEDVDYSEQEDEEEDRLLENDVVPESDGPGVNGREGRRQKSSRDKGKGRAKDRQHGRKKSKKSKGKERQSFDDEEDSIHAADNDLPALSDVEEETSPQGKKNKPGPLLQEAKEKIAAAGAQFRAQLMEYSAEYRKDFNEIVFTAGWAIRSERQGNPYNLFKRWYPYTHDKDEDSEYLLLVCFTVYSCLHDSGLQGLE